MTMFIQIISAAGGLTALCLIVGALFSGRA